MNTTTNPTADIATETREQQITRLTAVIATDPEYVAAHIGAKPTADAQASTAIHPPVLVDADPTCATITPRAGCPGDSITIELPAPEALRASGIDPTGIVELRAVEADERTARLWLSLPELERIVVEARRILGAGQVSL